jgi:rod shape-determining protein MreD
MPAQHGGPVIVVSFLVAIVLTILPLPIWARPFRPEWYALVLIYWCLAAPSRVGVGAAWLLGIALDVLRGALLGQHALGLSVLAYLTLKLRQRVRAFPLWQQAVTVLVLLAIEQLLSLWALGIAGHPPQSWSYWAPSVVGMLLWPWIFVVLRDVHRRFGVA